LINQHDNHLFHVVPSLPQPLISVVSALMFDSSLFLKYTSNCLCQSKPSWRKCLAFGGHKIGNVNCTGEKARM